MHPVVELRKVTPLEKQIVNRLLRERVPISQADLIDGLPDAPSQSTVNRAVTRLMEKGIVTRKGKTRGARFVLSKDTRHFATSPRLRLPTPFDPARIASYEPNRTAWLPEPLREGMAAAGEGVCGHLDASTYSRQIAERFMIDLSWASSRMEGNTYDFLETEMLIRYGQEADGHDRAEALMILNHKKAIGHMLDHLDEGVPGINDIHRLHALMMTGLMTPREVGRVRSHHVQISSSSYIPCADPRELAFQQVQVLSHAAEIEDPFEASFFLLAATSYLQAFGDGNKRMGRLLSNVPLLGAKKPPLSFVDIDRTAYILGLIVFYETGETELLAEAIAESYKATAPQYQASLSSARLPGRLEVQEARRISDCIKGIVLAGASVEDVPKRVASIFTNLPEGDRADLVGIIRERLEGLNPAQSIVHGLNDAQVASWLDDEAPGP